MRKLIGAVLCVIGIAIPVGLQAMEEEDNQIETEISFYLTKEDRFTYEVKVNDGGYLYDGSQRITNGVVAYELSVGENKKFQIEAKKGYEVKEIKINTERIDTDSQEIEIQGVSAPSHLEVRYGRVEEVQKPPDKEEIKPSPSQEPKKEEMEQKQTSIPMTGDMLKISEYVCLMLIVLYRMYVSKRGIDMQSHVDNKKG